MQKITHIGLLLSTLYLTAKIVVCMLLVNKHEPKIVLYDNLIFKVLGTKSADSELVT